MKRMILILALLGLSAWAQTDPAAAIRQTREDIARETAALAAQEARHGEERRVLLDALARQEAATRVLREEVDRLRATQREDADQVRRQEEELFLARQETAEVRALARESRRALDARLSPAAAELVLDTFVKVDASLDQNDPASAAEAARGLLDAGGIILDRMAAGTSLPGTAVLSDGRELKGTVILRGPLLAFVGEGGASQGLLVERPGDPLPRLWPLEAPGFAALARGEAATVPVDLTGGRALALGEIGKPLLAKLREGGVVMIPLFFTALGAIVLTLWKTVSLWRVRGRDAAAVDAVADALAAGDPRRARERLATVAAPLSSVLEGGVDHPKASREDLEEIMHERMLALLPQLDRHLGTLAVLGGIAPLLGLLGTVTGMIHTFELVTVFGSGNERVLSQGISEALVTTMAGLSIAVPVLLVHAFLARRVRVIIGELEQSIARFIHRLHATGETA
jgi:biopolymer transport protein ExbB